MSAQRPRPSLPPRPPATATATLTRHQSFLLQSSRTPSASTVSAPSPSGVASPGSPGQRQRGLAARRGPQRAQTLRLGDLDPPPRPQPLPSPVRRKTVKQAKSPEVAKMKRGRSLQGQQQLHLEVIESLDVDRENTPSPHNLVRRLSDDDMVMETREPEKQRVFGFSREDQQEHPPVEVEPPGLDMTQAMHPSVSAPMLVQHTSRTNLEAMEEARYEPMSRAVSMLDVPQARQVALQQKSGHLEKRSRTGLRWNKRWVVVKSRQLHTYRRQGAMPKIFSLVGASVRNSHSSRRRFLVTTARGEKLEFAVPSSDDCKEWIGFIRDHIDGLVPVHVGSPARSPPPPRPARPPVSPLPHLMADESEDEDDDEEEEQPPRPVVSPSPWNTSFQQVLDMDDPDLDMSVMKAARFSKVVQDFTDECREVVTTIIHEFSLPARLKSIAPIDENDAEPETEVFEHKGIVYSFTHDAGDREADESCMKVANNELRGCQAYLNAGVPELRVPLRCVVTYMGFRVEAIAALPIYDESTVVFGNVTSGWKHDESMLQQLRQAADALNLQGHSILVSSSDRPGRKQSVTTYTSVMSQVHRCEDGRSYIINLARLFPSDATHSGENPFWYVQALRPELVAVQPVPLTPNAFMAVSTTGDSDNLRVAEACKDLHHRALDSLVRALDSLEEVPVTSEQFTALLHRHGINCRRLGDLAAKVALPHVRELATAEMVARVAKVLLRRNLRKILRTTTNRGVEQDDEDEPEEEDDEELLELGAELVEEMHAGIVDFFNLVLGAGSNCGKFWKNLARKVAAKFKYEGPISQDSVHLGLLFHALQSHCGVEFASTDEYEFASPRCPEPLEFDDLVHVFPRCKVLRLETLSASALAASTPSLIEAGKWKEAARAAQVQLDVLNRQESDLFDERFIVALTQAGRVAIELDKVDLAKHHLKQTLPLTPQFHAFTGESLLLLMRVYFQQAMESVEEEAEPGGGGAAAEEDEQWGILPSLESSVGSASMLMNLTEFVFAKQGHPRHPEAVGHLKRALACFKQAVQSIVFHLGKHHPVVVDAYAQLAALFLEDEQPRPALWIMEQVVSMAMKMLGAKHSRTGAYLSRLGDIYSHNQIAHWESARNMYDQALAVFQIVHGAESLEVAAVKYALSNVLFRLGDYGAACRAGQAAVAIRESKLGTTHALSVESMYQVATQAETREDYATAIEVYEQLLQSLTERSKLAAIGRSIARLILASLDVKERALVQQIVEEHEEDMEMDVVMQIEHELARSHPQDFTHGLIERACDDKLVGKESQNGLRLCALVLLTKRSRVLGGRVEEPCQHSPEDEDEHKREVVEDEDEEEDEEEEEEVLSNSSGRHTRSMSSTHPVFADAPVPQPMLLDPAAIFQGHESDSDSDGSQTDGYTHERAPAFARSSRMSRRLPKSRSKQDVQSKSRLKPPREWHSDTESSDPDSD